MDDKIKVSFELRDKRRHIRRCQNCTNGIISPAGFILCKKRKTYTPRHGSKALTCEYYNQKIKE